MKKGTLLVLILLAVYGNVYCDDIAYTVTQNTHLRRGESSNSNITGTVKTGETVFFQGRISFSYTEYAAYNIYVKTEQGREGFIDARHILLKDNQPLPASVTTKTWIPSYYEQFLRGVEKERLFYFEPFWRDGYYEHTKEWGYDPDPWWFFAGHTHYDIHNNLIYIAGVYVQDHIVFLNVNQLYNLDTVTISVICHRKSNNTPNNSLNILFNEGEAYTLTLRIDGDYMDVYVNDNKEKIATLIGVDEYFQKSINKIFRGETVDLSLITWPKRADGSMDDHPIPTPSTPEETKQPEPIEFSVDSSGTESQQTDQNSAKTSAMPLWAWFAIIGGAIVIAGGAVVFVVRRRK